MLNVTRSQTVRFIFISVILCSIISCKNHNASEVSSSKSNTKVDVTNPNFNQNEIRRMVKAAENSEYECPINRKEYDAFQTKYPGRIA